VLKTSIAEVRKALGETAKAPQYIVTVQRRGYRFLGTVVEHAAGMPGPASPVPPAAPERPQDTPTVSPRPDVVLPPTALTPPVAERRHLTVLFCDLVDSTPLAEHLDPEDYRAVVQAYQQTCAAVVQRFDGYIAAPAGNLSSNTAVYLARSSVRT
jgi:hypothetical protein